MKEKPILFNGEMVQAILRDIDPKTMTRRVVKGDPQFTFDSATKVNGGIVDSIGQGFECPYGKVGDRLWVKETFGSGEENNTEPGIYYRATDPGWDDNDTGFRWKPSIFMPRWASRITLEITNIRVERLQDITEEDAIAEGIFGRRELGGWKWMNYLTGNLEFISAIESFRTLWESINGAGSWDKNDWVWVIEFKRVSE